HRHRHAGAALPHPHSAAAHGCRRPGARTMMKTTRSLRHCVRLAAFALVVTFAAGAAAQERPDGKWVRYGGGVESAWDALPDAANPMKISLRRRDGDLLGPRKRVFVLYPRPSSAYDIAITKILHVFETKETNAEFTVVNFDMNDRKGGAALQVAEHEKSDLIFAMGSESTAWLYDNYQGGAIPVVSVCSKDPVQLGQMKDYSSGSKSNFAFTSLNVPVDVQMAYVRELNPDLKNLAVLVDSRNISSLHTPNTRAAQPQAEPIANYARQRGIQVIWAAVQNPAKAREELPQIVREAVQTMRKSDPDLSKSLFWVTGSTSVFLEIRTINE